MNLEHLRQDSNRQNERRAKT